MLFHSVSDGTNVPSCITVYYVSPSELNYILVEINGEIGSQIWVNVCHIIQVRPTSSPLEAAATLQVDVFIHR